MKRCPFCHNQPRFFDKIRFRHMPCVRIWWVACIGPKSCGMLGPERESKEQAEADWDRIYIR